MRALFPPSVALILLACAPHAAPPVRPQVVPQAAVSGLSQWEPDIQRFETADRTNPPHDGGFVFVGSSSIRMWQTLESDFPGLRVLNRGFGGSELSDVLQFADRIVVRYKPRVVIVYAGDNDLAAGKTPAQVFADFQSFVAIIHRELPETRVAFVSIKPSIARLNIIDKIRQDSSNESAGSGLRAYGRQARVRRRLHPNARRIRSAESGVVSRGRLAHERQGLRHMA
jgi:lysophospholipase L1-like esterase